MSCRYCRKPRRDPGDLEGRAQMNADVPWSEGQGHRLPLRSSWVRGLQNRRMLSIEAATISWYQIKLLRINHNRMSTCKVQAISAPSENPNRGHWQSLKYRDIRKSRTFKSNGAILESIAIIRSFREAAFVIRNSSNWGSGISQVLWNEHVIA